MCLFLEKYDNFIYQFSYRTSESPAALSEVIRKKMPSLIKRVQKNSTICMRSLAGNDMQKQV